MLDLSPQPGRECRCAALRMAHLPDRVRSASAVLVVHRRKLAASSEFFPDVRSYIHGHGNDEITQWVRTVRSPMLCPGHLNTPKAQMAVRGTGLVRRTA